MRAYRSKPAPDASTIEAALDAMDADGLRIAGVTENKPY